MGIPSEVLLKMFQRGFSTKRVGNGFGLHSSANLAKEMGGSLRAFSDGLGCGSTFVLRISTLPPEE